VSGVVAFSYSFPFRVNVASSSGYLDGASTASLPGRMYSMDGVLRGAVARRRRGGEVGPRGEQDGEQTGSVLPLREGAAFICLTDREQLVVLEPLSSSALRPGLFRVLEEATGSFPEASTSICRVRACQPTRQARSVVSFPCRDCRSRGSLRRLSSGAPQDVA
jgi:hypothetical protein